MSDVDSKILTDKIINQPEDTAIFVACSGEEKFGFIHVHSSHDYYNSEKHGHISDIIVSRKGEGKGIASMLMTKAENWAASLGYKWLTLSVFAENTRAREIYEKLGYGADIVKYVKPL